MNRTRRKGFLLFYVLAIVVLVGGAVVILTDACTTMVFETREMHLDACARNLAASGAAWARRANAAGPLDRALDANALAAPDAALRVRLHDRDVSVEASCRQGRRIRKRRADLTLD